ncbi:PKD domain-containing protein [Geodermatophilus sp. SYSU D00708]
MSADALPTVQIDGVVWSQVVVGNRVYAAGKFTRARPAGAPAGTQEVVRNNLLAYDIRTGELVTSFVPDLNGQAMVVTASPDGKRIYVGGDFTKANGQTRNRIAAYDTATGALVTTFKPSVNKQVRALAATNTTVYLGGSFSAVGSVSRTRLAAVSASNGALQSWAPRPGAAATDGSDTVLSLVVTNGGTQVVAAGRFATLNGVAAPGVGALHATTGATRTFAVNKLVTNQGINSAIWNLSTDGTTVYGSGYDFGGPGNLEGTFAATAAGGALVSVAYCRGDNYSSFATGGALYIASHMHNCSYVGGYPEQNPQVFKFATAFSTAVSGTVATNTFRNKNFAGKPALPLLPWFPTMTPGTYTGQFQAGWSVTGNSSYVVYGGEFPRVNGVGQQGLVRYAVPKLAPNDVGPDDAGLAPTFTALADGALRVAWQATNDQDNQYLTYRVYRDRNPVPIHETTQPSTWWNEPAMSIGDTGLSAGTHEYQVTATDPMGNVARSPWTPVTVAAGAPARPYADAVRADGAAGHWSLGERTGSTAFDLAARTDLTLGTGVTREATGALSGDADGAVTLDGSTTTAYAGTPAKIAAPQTFTVEAWFRTTSATGGRIVGFTDAVGTGTGRYYDRLVYLDSAGRVSFGVYSGAKRIVQTATAYNDGAWHHVAASMGKQGMALYVDGTLVGSRTDTTTGQVSTGNWRIGADKSWSGLASFNGSIDEVAVYPTVLSAAQVAAHVAAGTSGTFNRAPLAAFTSAVTHLDASFDAAGSGDGDGTVTGYAWSFGDGSTATGATARHTYTAAGSYTVRLTVTDDDGASSTAQQTVTVTAPPPNQPPSAAFTATASGLAVLLDGRGSADTDGTVASYEWAWGDGTPAGSGATAQHTYAQAGTYTVRLTVTDDDGATASTTRQVTVTAPPTGVVAADAFGRTVSGGLGTADVGGAWTASVGASRLSVTPGTAVLGLPGAGNNTGAYLGDVSVTDADVRAKLALSAAPVGGPVSMYVVGRRVDAANEYAVNVKVAAGGQVSLLLSRVAGNVEAWPGGEVVVPGLTYEAGTVLNVRVQVSGTGTTTVKATVWAEGSAEPATPQLTRTDTTAALQEAGSVGLSAYRAGSSTEATTVRVTGFEVTEGR